MKNLLLSITATTFSGMPSGQPIFGCVPCVSVWSGDQTCFLCDQQALVIAKPIDLNGVIISAPKDSMMISNTHYVDNPEIIALLKTALKFI